MAEQRDLYDHRPGETGNVVRGVAGEAEMVRMLWGLKPPPDVDRPLANVRSEGRTFPLESRCLVPATEFFVPPRHKPAEVRWEVTVPTEEPFFCFAGVWRRAADGWPDAYAVLTVATGPDLALYTGRQLVIILRTDWQAWLFGGKPEEELLRPSPAGCLKLERMSRAGAAGDLFDRSAPGSDRLQ